MGVGEQEVRERERERETDMDAYSGVQRQTAIHTRWLRNMSVITFSPCTHIMHAH